MLTHSSYKTIFCAPRRHVDIGSHKSKFKHEFMVVGTKAPFCFVSWSDEKKNLHELKFIAHPPLAERLLTSRNRKNTSSRLVNNCKLSGCDVNVLCDDD